MAAITYGLFSVALSFSRDRIHIWNYTVALFCDKQLSFLWK